MLVRISEPAEEPIGVLVVHAETNFCTNGHDICEKLRYSRGYGSGTDLVIRLLPTDEEVSGNRFGRG